MGFVQIIYLSVFRNFKSGFVFINSVWQDINDDDACSVTSNGTLRYQTSGPGSQLITVSSRQREL